MKKHWKVILGWMVMWPSAVGLGARFDTPETVPAVERGRGVLGDPVEFVRRLAQYVRDAGIGEPAARQVALQRLEVPVSDLDQAQARVEAALVALYPDLLRALEDLAWDRWESAAALNRLMQSSNPYLAAHSCFLLAQGLVEQERYEEAMPLLERFMAEGSGYSLRATEALFLLAHVQAHLMDHHNALENLKQLLQEPAGLPIMLRQQAQALARSLEQFQEGSLEDVARHMAFSRRRLALGDSSRDTQVCQQRILELLDRLIKQSEQQEQQATSSSQSREASAGPARGSASPSAPATQSVAPEGRAARGPLHGMLRDDRSWGDPRQRQRDQVLETLQGRFPEHYRELIEQYYRSLQEYPADSTERGIRP